MVIDGKHSTPVVAPSKYHQYHQTVASNQTGTLVGRGALVEYTHSSECEVCDLIDR